MKKLALAVATLFVAAAPIASHAWYDRDGNWHADRDRSYDEPRGDWARVIESRPVYSDAGQRQECWSNRDNQYEEPHNRPNNTGAGTAGGAVVGGVIGHQFDHGSAGATLGGALIGGLIGNRVAKEHDESHDPDMDYNRCRMVGDAGHVLQGYETRYEYRGREYTAMLPNDPGPRVRVADNGQIY